jgi:hypothetical protein
MMLKMEGGKCIATEARLTTTLVQSESITTKFQTLLHIHLKFLKILIIAIQGSVVRSQHNTSGKNCCIKTW